MAQCECGSGVDFSDCCQLVITHQSAATPEQLMRSRYCAFVHHNADYLLATLHPSRHQPNERQSLQQHFTQMRWLGLQVLARGEHWVEFVAFYQANNSAIEQLHERSRFVFENEKWFYLEGDFLPAIKLGRNDSCFCGSGKKLKKCHGNEL